MAMGCTAVVDIPHPPPAEPPPIVPVAGAGSLTLRWLVAGTNDPNLCSVYGASTVELLVFDESGARVATANGACESFSLSLTLLPGTYTAETTLLDARGQPVSTTKQLLALRVIRRTDLAVDVDFTQSSML
jgi:hypothetical protein